MQGDNLYLVAGTYSASATAAEDYKALRAGEKDGKYEVVASVVMNRDASGKVDVDEHGDGRVGGGAILGGTAGLVVGLFAPPLLAATAVGAGIGAVGVTSTSTRTGTTRSAIRRTTSTATGRPT